METASGENEKNCMSLLAIIIRYRLQNEQKHKAQIPSGNIGKFEECHERSWTQNAG
jgi:hypothetical protein